MDFMRCHIVMFGVEKFCAGLMIGFGLRANFLLILIAAKGLDSASSLAFSDGTLARGKFVQDLPGSSGLHWGDGVIMVNADCILFGNKVAVGPDYRLYLTSKYDETGSGFQTIKAQSLQIVAIRALKNFSLDLRDGMDVTNYLAVSIWCVSLGQFISAAELQQLCVREVWLWM